MSQVISEQSLRQLADSWISQGRKVAGPAQASADRILYQWVDQASDLLLKGWFHPANSVKEFVFPRSEKLYGYRFVEKQIELYDIPQPDVPQLIVGARPCDAAAFPILDHVFNWDYKDEFYNRRRELTTIVTIGCTSHDAFCFCTSVGLGPAAEKGSDVLLLDLGDGNYEVRHTTAKGDAFLAGKAQLSDRTAQVPAGPPVRFKPEAIQQFLNDNFESPLWQQMTLRCMGCGACAFTCPTCHCFDIVDEGNAAGGARVKNWDTCQSGQFTLHASGHNPRDVQPQRQRQRIFHKFQIYPNKFGEILCTGCGDCTRNCPVGLGIATVLEAVESMVDNGSSKPQSQQAPAK